VQKVKGREGELWGLSNLFAFTSDRIKTLDVLDDCVQQVRLGDADRDPNSENLVQHARTSFRG